MQISVKSLTKIYNKPVMRPHTGLFASDGPKPAVQDITFTVKAGESIGIIGENGSGKSTLLKLLCGVTAPTYGKISVNGKISSLLELGAGFNLEYNGISNIYLYGTIMGLKRSEIKSLIPQITEFADIGEYISKPVRTYSDGMFLRLAFACASAIAPDILIIDEALAVGDFKFRQKCFNKINALKADGVTILLVSHDIDTIRRFCSRTLWLADGVLKMDGDTRTVSAAYMKYVTGSSNNILHKESCSIPAEGRFGSAVGAIKSVDIPEIQRHGSPMHLSFDIDIPHGIPLNSAAVSVSFKNIFGLDLAVYSTADCGIKFDRYGRTTVDLNCKCLLCGGEYSVCVSLDDRSSVPIKYYDYVECAGVLKVVSDDGYFGVFHSEASFNIR